jgi:hypothetical protein
MCRSIGLICVWSAAAVCGAADEPLRTLDSHFPFQVPVSREAWDQQAADLRQRLKVVLGLWPSPLLDPVAPVAHGRRAMDGYSVEKIYFESLPGLWVTGSLYRPEPMPAQPTPGVLSPHGHWANGRFYDAGRSAALRDLAIGAERFESAAHAPLQARCVQLARMGCTVLHWDMMGYADSRPISIARAHSFARFEQGEQPVTDDGWLLYSVPAEAHGQSVMGLQTINTLRALEVLRGLPGVDPERIAITGASGGGTQSFIAAAINAQIQTAFPAVMVSTGMQGGCTCENACGLRVGAGNVALAACIAPRPLGMTAADDWTRTMPGDGFPELQAVYALYGARERVELFPFLHFPHNYNHPSRTAMYGWLNRQFTLGLDEPVLERDFSRLSASELTVWDPAHPDPGSSLEQERQVLQQWHARTRRVLEDALAQAASDRGAALMQILRPAFNAIVRRLPGAPAEFRWEVSEKREVPEGLLIRGTLNDSAWSQQRDAIFLYPTTWSGEVVLLANSSPAARRLSEGSRGHDEILRDVAKAQPGRAVALIDLHAADELRTAQGEAGDSGHQPLVQRERLAAAYTYGYNDPLVVRQAQDLLMLAAFCRGDEHQPSKIHLLADRSATPAAALAAAVAGDLLDSVELDVHGFRFEKVAAIDSLEFCPLVGRYFDVDGLLAACAPRPLRVQGETSETLPVTQAIYAAFGEAVQWLDATSR